ncbi:MAG: hypothetical protein H8F28_23420, partial [Fibrella sp.]|nr:hypothetical protein [Armatimonadota bacterium]
YLQDFDETYPRAWYVGNGPSNASRYRWLDGLAAYVKNEKVFTCPSDDSNKPYKFQSGRDYGSYAMNAAYWAGTDNAAPPYEQSVAALVVPAQTIWVMETANTGLLNNYEIEWPNSASNPAITKGPEGIRVMRNVGERHHGTTNVLWCDGHAKAHKLDYLAKTNSRNVRYMFSIQDDENK